MLKTIYKWIQWGSKINFSRKCRTAQFRVNAYQVWLKELVTEMTETISMETRLSWCQEKGSNLQPRNSQLLFYFPCDHHSSFSWQQKSIFPLNCTRFEIFNERISLFYLLFYRVCQFQACYFTEDDLGATLVWVSIQTSRETFISEGADFSIGFLSPINIRLLQLP